MVQADQKMKMMKYPKRIYCPGSEKSRRNYRKI